jgi:hypothetical protein
VIEADSNLLSNGLTIKNAVFHDNRCDYSGGPWDCHLECIKMNGGQNVVIQGNHFYDCEYYAIFVAHESSAEFNGLVIENNWFDVSWNGNANSPAHNRSQAVSFACKGRTFENVDVRFNSFHSGATLYADEDGCGNNSSFRVTGNLLGNTSPSCAPGTTFRYNVYRGSSVCGGTGNVALNAQFPFVNGSLGAAGNYDLAATSVIDNLVPASVGCPATDIHGRARPVGTHCDAGAQER